MTIAKFALAALALAVSAGGAFATQDRRGAKVEAVPMSLERSTGARATGLGLPQSKPTIWGHAVEQRRTTNDVGRVITGG